jgi:hypothetical protein
MLACAMERMEPIQNPSRIGASKRLVANGASLNDSTALASADQHGAVAVALGVRALDRPRHGLPWSTARVSSHARLRNQSTRASLKESVDARQP